MIRRALPFITLVALAGCSPSMPSSLTPEQAQVAIQEAAASQAQAMQVSAPSVTGVELGDCKRSDSHPILACPHARFSIGGAPIETHVDFWATPNPAHPYRAHFSLSSPTSKP